MAIKFSVLTPAIPERKEKAFALYEKIQKQMSLIKREDVEHLLYFDNKRRSIGAKRDSMIQAAQGKFIAFCDDDDDISDNYIFRILEAIDKHPDVDVITFNQRAHINGEGFNVDFGLENENEESVRDKDGKLVDIKRKPFHVCAWRRMLAHIYHPTDYSYGEDYAWVEQIIEKEEKLTEYKIDEVLHYYYYDENLTAAPKT